jgi:hypothetical protein
MIAMSMGDDRTIDRFPWVDEEIPGVAVEAAGGKGKQGHTGW